MSDSLGITVTGFAELKRKIELLASDKDKKKEMLLILRQVAKPTLLESDFLAPIKKDFKSHKVRGVKVTAGNLKRSIGLITGKSSNPTIFVGARAKGVNKGWYAHFVHDGINVYHKGFKRKHKKGANTHAAIRRTKANPFLAKAYAATQSIVTSDAERKMALFIQRRIDKLS